MKFLTATVLAGTVLLGAETGASAQWRGGYRGGYYGGSGYRGGFYGTAYPGGVYGGYYGNYYTPGFNLSFGVPIGGYSYPWGYSRYNYGYGTPYTGGAYTYGGSAAYPTVPTYSAAQPATTATTPAPAPASDPNAVNMEVRLPSESATLWIEGQQLNETGAVRHFVSPPIATGKTFVYNVKASWTAADGKPVEKTKQVDVKAGDWVGVDFNREK